VGEAHDAADLAAAGLAAQPAFAVDCGGDIRIGGSEALLRPYEVHVEHPLTGERAYVLRLGAGGVATSGIDVRIWRDADGGFAHHLLDPASGKPAWTGLIGVTALGESAVEADFRNFVAWKHSGRAVWMRGASLKLTGAVLADNAIGATFASYQTSVEDALFVGETANNASTLSSGTPRRGYEFYDGTVGADRVKFVNYNGSASIPWSALGFLRNNGFSVSTANYAGALEFTNANRYYLETPHADKDGDKAAVFYDRDGMVSGINGGYVVPDLPFLITPSCTLRPEWNAYVCPNRYVGLSIRSDAENVAPLMLVRDGDAASLDLVGVPGNPDAAFASVIPGRRYTVQYAGAVPQAPKLYLDNVGPGEWVRVTLPYPQAPSRIVRDYWAGNPVVAAADLASLDASAGDRYYYDAGAGLLHLKLMPMEDRDWATQFVE